MIRSHFHIFIDLDTRTHRKKTYGLKCHLADVPVTLNFGKHLINVIIHIPDHFIDYCQKPSGRWRKCDDMQLNVKECDETIVEFVSENGDIKINMETTKETLAEMMWANMLTGTITIVVIALKFSRKKLGRKIQLLN
ncbi:uncharacterized protein [Polyergus mexicanus]|uniref:uncharacterized protein n=1 Tax=Polyergus mexicanus TaxID=615972 RepID=UPI0038B6A9F5